MPKRKTYNGCNKEEEIVLKRILEEAEVTNYKGTLPCNQCKKEILNMAKCYRIGHSYFCSERCVKGD